MTALLEEKDRPYETAEEMDTTDAKETDATDAKETDTMDTKEMDATDTTDTKETNTLTIPLVTSNDLRDLTPSAQR